MRIKIANHTTRAFIVTSYQLSGSKPIKALGEESKKLFFRNLFIDGQDSDIGRIIFNYFSARCPGPLEDIEGLLKK